MKAGQEMKENKGDKLKEIEKLNRCICNNEALET
jgi:hypothetical protein